MEHLGSVISIGAFLYFLYTYSEHLPQLRYYRDQNLPHSLEDNQRTRNQTTVASGERLVCWYLQSKAGPIDHFLKNSDQNCPHFLEDNQRSWNQTTLASGERLVGWHLRSRTRPIDHFLKNRSSTLSGRQPENPQPNNTCFGRSSCRLASPIEDPTHGPILEK